jgi:hypothetical protein|tara:strand:+ start:126 stop:434 length:309 start_codon:yes stop_codon:yes gene_type:complete
MKKWIIEWRKQRTELWVSNQEEAIFIGECDDGITTKQKKRNRTLAKIICDALREHDPEAYSELSKEEILKKCENNSERNKLYDHNNKLKLEVPPIQHPEWLV